MAPRKTTMTPVVPTTGDAVVATPGGKLPTRARRQAAKDREALAAATAPTPEPTPEPTDMLFRKKTETLTESWDRDGTEAGSVQ